MDSPMAAPQHMPTQVTSKQCAGLERNRHGSSFTYIPILHNTHIECGAG
jgi:hypothetical protein